MVEALQNISKHADSVIESSKKSIGKGVFLISHNSKELKIITGNIVKKEKEQNLS
jgi:hypothetical protein